MIFSRIILLLFIIQIGVLEAIKTVSTVIHDSAEVKVEKLLMQFMIDIQKFKTEKLDHHRLIVLGKKENFLQATKVLLENGTSYFVSSKAEATVLPSNFGARNIVLFFIDGFSDFEMNLTLAKLPEDFECKLLMISIEANITDRSVATMIDSAEKSKLRNVLVARFDGRVIKIYGRRMDTNCEPEIKLLNKWIPKKGFRRNRSVLGLDPIKNEHGCPKFVSTFRLMPMMELQENENKSWHIVGGPEGRLVETVAEYLNIGLVVKVPTIDENLRFSSDGTAFGIVGEVARGLASFGIGQIRPTSERAKLVDFTNAYNRECIVWTVPLRTTYKHSIVFSEFSPTTWILVILSISLCCGLAYTIPRLNLGTRSSLNVFDIIAMTLNYSIPWYPSGVLWKILFLLYLHYCRVISTAYSTSLSSILTATTPEPAILDEKGILAAGFRTAGTPGSLEILANQISLNSSRSDLINRYEVISSIDAALARIVDHQDIAYLRPLSTITYAAEKLAMASKPIEFYSLPDCVISYSSVMVTPKGSRLTGPVDDVIRRVRESGIYQHWMNLDRVLEFSISKFEPNNHTLSRLKPIFILYLCCLIPALLTFVAELVVFKLKLNWFTR